MALPRPLGKITIPPAHLPTWFFVIGYPLFWLELYTHDASQGTTSPLAWMLFGVVAFISVRHFKLDLRWIQGWFWRASVALALVIVGIVVLAALKPIHLIQEFDCLQYHYTLPRQHLILGSFTHIRWAADDLFLLPVDFALAPFWFATVLPNKIPQLIILFGLMAVAARLTSALAGKGKPWAGPLTVLVILGTHGLGIQMGTGMLDLTVVYLFLAALDSLRLGQWFLAGVEFTFFFWSKPLMPLEAVLILGSLGLLYILARWGRWQIVDEVTLKGRGKALGLFLALSVIVAGPFIAKSMYYAGTPFFPLTPGMMEGAKIQKHPQAWQSLQQSSQIWMSGSQNNYGHGRGLAAFMKHWWLLAVPEQGVNNAFDYPLGLTYLLMIGPFLFFLIKDISQRRFSILGMLAAVSWVLWWFSVQQSRFLYLPLLIVFIVTISRLEKMSRILFVCVLISGCLEAVSLWGAHKADMGRWGINDLREKDKELMSANHRYLEGSLSGPMDWPSHDAAYAQFPVTVHQENLPHTILF